MWSQELPEVQGGECSIRIGSLRMHDINKLCSRSDVIYYVIHTMLHFSYTIANNLRAVQLHLIAKNL